MTPPLILLRLWVCYTKLGPGLKPACIIFGLDMNYFKSEDRLTDMYGDAGKQLIINGINVREGSGQLVYKCELDNRKSLDLVHVAAD